MTRQNATPGGDIPDAFILALAAGGTVTDAAKAGGVSRQTGSGWAQRPEVLEAVRRARGELWARALGILSAASIDAAQYLGDVVRGTADADRSRLTACRAVIRDGMAARDAVELEARIVALEAAAATNTSGRWR